MKSTTSSTEINGDSGVDEIKSDKPTLDLAKNATGSEDTVDVAVVEQQGESFVLEQQQQQQQSKPPPPPAAAQWETQSAPPSYDNQAAAWQDERLQQQQHYNNQYNQGQQQYAAEQQQYDANLYYLQDELSESLARENSLVSQLDNLTTTAVAMEQREELHKHQLDVLTERIVDVESRSADDRTLLIEYEANCTALGTNILALQEDLDEWQERCNEWNQKHEDDQEKLSELRQAIKETVSEAEDLAIAMEELRMTEKRRHQSTTKSNAKRSGGLVSWMWSMIGFGNSSNKNNRYDDEIREDAFEMAKSTLLRALQSERTNVHELESAVASLQQNNSAISEMVESRDNIIDELNNRIAVFEEDKVVLKAALRQLQKEMKEEEPKTQKLIDDLVEAEQEIDRIKADFHSIIETHQDELANLQGAMSQKQKTITDAESNLTSIGTYVDKLEERLTSFAMTRRDMEDREKICKEIEKKAQESEIQRKSIEGEVEELKKQEDELKKLLEELAMDRTDLQKENRRLYTEQEFRIGEQENLASQYETSQAQSASMRQELEEWKAKCENFGPDLEASRKCQLDLERQVEALTGTQKQLNTLQIENAVVVETNGKLQEEITASMEEKDRMEAKLMELTKEIEERKEAERLASELAEKAEAEMLAKEEAKARRPPPPPPRRSAQQLTKKPNEVPLRSLRKTLSKATGLHGVLTPSSSKNSIETTNTRRQDERPPPHEKTVQLTSKVSEDANNNYNPPTLPPTTPFQEQNQ
jgi:chromosome segregation ATPase